MKICTKTAVWLAEQAMASVHFKISMNEREFCSSPLLHFTLIRLTGEVLHIYNPIQSIIRLFLHRQREGQRVIQYRSKMAYGNIPSFSYEPMLM